MGQCSRPCAGAATDTRPRRAPLAPAAELAAYPGYHRPLRRSTPLRIPRDSDVELATAVDPHPAARRAPAARLGCRGGATAQPLPPYYGGVRTGGRAPSLEWCVATPSGPSPGARGRPPRRRLALATMTRLGPTSAQRAGGAALDRGENIGEILAPSRSRSCHRPGGSIVTPSRAITRGGLLPDPRGAQRARVAVRAASLLDRRWSTTDERARRGRRPPP